MANYRTPGVYVEEISTLPPSVAEVATAVPAFIGYTETGPTGTAEPEIVRITSMLEFITAFGGAPPSTFTVTLPANASDLPAVQGPNNTHKFTLYYALSLYFKNGGGPCYVVSVGNYTSDPDKTQFLKGLAALKKEDEPTLIVLTDAARLLSAGDYYGLCGEALMQCQDMGDRFTILDVPMGDTEAFRNDSNLSINLMYGAAYTPYLNSSLNYVYSESDVEITGVSSSQTSWSKDFGGNGLLITYNGAETGPQLKIIAAAGNPITFEGDGGALTIRGSDNKTAQDITDAWNALSNSNKPNGFGVQANGDGSDDVDHTSNAFVALVKQAGGDVGGTMASLIKDNKGLPVAKPNTGLYNQIKTALAEQRVELPPSAAMAGIYARVDREQGVWKAPANTGVMGILGPVEKITDDDQDRLNIDPTAGKSINAIRAFTGKGTLVWGARTLAGNDNEWRYVSVRRLFITIEESTKKASAFAVFEANDQSTWLKVKAMIESYLYGLWEQGALAGSKPEDAYYVNVGLGKTMTPQDVLEGRMIVEIGIAAVRPAEFIILKFSHKLQTT